MEDYAEENHQYYHNTEVVIGTPVPNTPTSSITEYSYESDGEGGVKKIIYNGSNKKRNLFDDDENFSQQWNYRNQQANGNKPGQFNLDDVWSIKKNVGVNKSPIANPAGGSFWERGAGKGYYSRHGGLSDEDNGLPTTTTQGSATGGSQQGRNYSYSYANNADRLHPNNAGGPSSTGTSPRGMPGSLRPTPTNNGYNTANNGSMMTNGGGPGSMSNGHSSNLGPTPTNMGMGGRHGGPVSNRYQGPMSNQPKRF